MLTPAERYFYDRGMYGTIARKVAQAMARDEATPCTPGAECDLDYRCEAHVACLEESE